MPKPTTKQELLDVAQKEYAALESYLATFTPKEMTAPGALGDWSVKDVLAHLFEWQTMLFGWYETGLRGETPAVPADGYKWSDLPALNDNIRQKYGDALLEDVIQEFRASHVRMVEFVNHLTEADLFTPGKYRWLNQNTLAAYCNACAGAHYRWARTDMRKTLKNKKL